MHLWPSVRTWEAADFSEIHGWAVFETHVCMRHRTHNEDPLEDSTTPEEVAECSGLCLDIQNPAVGESKTRQTRPKQDGCFQMFLLGLSQFDINKALGRGVT